MRGFHHSLGFHLVCLGSLASIHTGLGGLEGLEAGEEDLEAGIGVEGSKCAATGVLGLTGVCMGSRSAVVGSVSPP